MRRRVLLLVLLSCGAAAAWACSLNPQPLPPDTFDASSGDGSLTASPDAAGGGVDAGFGAEDGGPPMNGDASTDAAANDAGVGDAATDAANDAGDAGEGDASTDAADAAALDAGDEG